MLQCQMCSRNCEVRTSTEGPAEIKLERRARDAGEGKKLKRCERAKRVRHRGSENIQGSA